MFSPQSRVSIKSGGLSEPPLFPPTIDLGLSPSWFFGRFEKAAPWSLLDGEAILIPEDGRGSPKGWLLVSQSEEPVLPAAVAVKCALALCTVHHLQVAQAWSRQCKCAHNGPLWWLPPLLGLQSSCRAAFVSGGAAPPRPRPGDQ